MCSCSIGGMEEEVDVFTLYLSSLRVAMGARPTTGTVGQ